MAEFSPEQYYFNKSFGRKLEIIYQRAPRLTTFEYDQVKSIFDCFFYYYYLYRGELHPDIGRWCILEILQVIDYAPSLSGNEDEGEDLFVEAYKGLIPLYFETAFSESCSYHINHFFSGAIRWILYQQLK